MYIRFIRKYSIASLLISFFLFNLADYKHNLDIMKTAIVPFLLLLNILVAVNAQTKDSVILVKDSITVKLPDVYVTSERPWLRLRTMPYLSTCLT